jgi:integrase
MADMDDVKVRGVYEHPRGSRVWWIQYFEHGRRRRERVGRKSDAKTLYQKRKTQILQGDKLPELQRRKVAVRDLVDLALSFARDNGRLMRNYEGKAAWLKDALGDRPAEDLLPSEVKAAIHRQGGSAATFNRYRSFISLCYREGQREGLVRSNPARLIAQKREPRGRERFLDRKEEFPKLVAAIAEKYSDRLDACEFSIFSGARLGEQFGLHWSEVSFDRREVKFLDTKNGEHRTVPMNEVMLEILTARKPQTRSARALVFGSLREFCCEPGAKLKAGVGEAGYSPKWFRDLCAEIGIADYTWHNNRHTFCSWLAIDGASLKEIQELAGHKDIKMSARYSHLSPDRKRSAMERLARPSPGTVIDFASATRTANR